MADATKEAGVWFSQEFNPPIGMAVSVGKSGVIAQVCAMDFEQARKAVLIGYENWLTRNPDTPHSFTLTITGPTDGNPFPAQARGKIELL